MTLKQYIFKTIRPHYRLFIVLALLGLAWAIIMTFLPYTLKLIIDHVVGYKGDGAILVKTTLPFVALYIGLWIAQCMNMRVLDFVKLKLFPSLREDVMSSMFRYTNQHSHQYFQNNFAGSLINKIGDMQNGIVDIFTTLDDAWAQMLGLIVAMVMLSFVHPIFAIILFLWTVFFLIITYIFLKPIEKLSTIYAESKTSFVGKMVDSISNILSVRLFARHQFENHYIDESIKDAVQKDRNMQLTTLKMRIWWDLSIILLLGINLCTLLVMYSHHLVTVGDFTFVMTLSISMLWCLWFLAGQFVSFSQTVGNCKQALTVISASHDITDSPNAKNLIIDKGEIAFDNVSFHYNQGNNIFENKNIVLQGGKKTGLVGFSGSGKSTFVNLILRLFDVEQGAILIDGQDIKQITQDSLRENIAFIPQDVSLFHRSLIENISYGNCDATESEIMAVSKKSHCHDFICQLPEGYDSLVGERGVKLSGGQRQRIAIARAMLKDAPILILDEATSALDSVTEKTIQEAFNILMQNKTTIVIAHRLSTLAEMDRILVFDNGKIIEDGSHDALLEKNGHYKKMWDMQAGGFLPDSLNSAES